MTRAPANLLAVRRLLLDHLNIDETRVRGGDLEPAEVGIVGDPAHRGGAHCGSDRVLRNSAGTITDYTVVESSRDRTGLTLDAAGLDVGWFEVRVGGVTHDLFTFNRWVVGQCRLGEPDTRDIREIIYSPDGRTVRRWDRLGRRSTGDDSHLWHTHFSFFRDSIKAGRDQTPLFRRYLTTIGLIIPTTEDNMELNELMAADMSYTGSGALTFKTLLRNLHQQGRGPSFPDWQASKDAAEVKATLAALTAQVAALTGKDFTDEPAIVAGVLAGLDPAAIAAAIPTDIAQQVADELSARLAG